MQLVSNSTRKTASRRPSQAQPRAKNSHAESLSCLSAARQAATLAGLSEETTASLLYDWKFWGRPNQHPPDGDWTTWLILAGRGFGKTRTGAEFVRAEVVGARARRIALVAETAADARDIMAEGESGILSISSPGYYPTYEPSKRRITWPNGAVATLYNAREPDQLRGPQHDLAWSDELAKWRYVQDTWDNLQLGLRLGVRPRQCVTTTPRPIACLRAIMADADTVTTRGSSYDNRPNLAAPFIERIIRRYEGTRLGRQELYAEIIDDTPGALWNRARIEELRRTAAPELKRIVIAIDPAVTATEDSDETGIVAAGVGEDGHGYVLEDLSLRASPDGWARAAVAAYHRLDADRIIGEVNNGGDLVEHVIRTVDPDASFRAVRASRGKIARAEPIAALYEQGRVHHVGGIAQLEDQMCTFTPDIDRSRNSPDRVDALVWALSALMLGRGRGNPHVWGV